MSAPDDPRVYFAAERTLLAWVRSGIACIGLGFVVAKFGIFLRLIAPSSDLGPRSQLSLAIGALLVVLGALACLGAAWQFRRFAANLGPAERPRHWPPATVVWMAYALAAIGLILACHLVIDAPDPPAGAAGHTSGAPAAVP